MAWLRSKRAQNAGRPVMLRVHLVSRMPVNDTGCEFANLYREAHADNAEVPISKKNQSIILAAKLREAPYRFSACKEEMAPKCPLNKDSLTVPRRSSTTMRAR